MADLAPDDGMSCVIDAAGLGLDAFWEKTLTHLAHSVEF